MPTYISLLRFTDQGARQLKNSTARAIAFDKAAAKAGVRIEAQYWMLGAYDGLLVLSASEEGKALQCLASLTAAGNVRLSTMQAYAAKEFSAMIGK